MELGSRDPISVVSGLPSPPQGLTGSGSLMWPQDTRGEPLPSIVVVLVGPLCFCSVLGKSLILLLSSSLQSVFKLKSAHCHKKQLWLLWAESCMAFSIVHMSNLSIIFEGLIITEEAACKPSFSISLTQTRRKKKEIKFPSPFMIRAK